MQHRTWKCTATSGGSHVCKARGFKRKGDHSRTHSLPNLLTRILYQLQEFYARCRASQELIQAQIPWASANAERSRVAAGRGSPQEQIRVRSAGDPNQPQAVRRSDSGEQPIKLTREEELLAALLASNEELTEALKLYEDLERVGIERETEERSKKEIRIDRSVSHFPSSAVLFELTLDFSEYTMIPTARSIWNHRNLCMEVDRHTHHPLGLRHRHHLHHQSQ